MYSLLFCRFYSYHSGSYCWLVYFCNIQARFCVWQTITLSGHYNISSVTPSHLQFHCCYCMVTCGVQVQSYMFIPCIVISVNEYKKTYRLSLWAYLVSRKVLSGVANDGWRRSSDGWEWLYSIDWQKDFLTLHTITHIID